MSADDVQDELDAPAQPLRHARHGRPPGEGRRLRQLDLVATIGDEEVDTANNISYEIGSGELIVGIDEALDSLTAGESTSFESTLIGGDSAGEKALINVTLLAVKERELPEADDDFARSPASSTPSRSSRPTSRSRSRSRRRSARSRRLAT
ncbi:MAG: hypothetical protein WDM88_05230 [Galbitalea sp.]